MNKVIKVIHPIKGKLEGDVYTPKPKKKVAAYARVSTNYQDQINSYIVQCDEYTKMIQSNPDYMNWYQSTGFWYQFSILQIKQSIIDGALKNRFTIVII